MPAGYVTIATPAGPVDYPVYDPADLAVPGIEMAAPDGSVVAFRLDPAPSLTPDYAVRVQGPNGGVWALDPHTSTLLDGFEDGAWPADWTNETQYYDVTADAITGEYSLEATSSSFQQVAKTGVSTDRGYSYSMRTVLAGSDAEAWLLTNVQDAGNAQHANYAAQLDPANDRLAIAVRDGGATTTNQTASVNLSFNTEYQLVADVEADRVQARVFNSSGTQLGATGWVATTRHTGGYIGVYTDGDDSAGTRYDDFTRHPLGAI